MDSKDLGNKDYDPVHVPVLPSEISIRSELVRKSIHLASLSIPIGYYFVSRSLALEIIVPMLLFSIFVDVGRHYWAWLGKIVNMVFKQILRPHEQDETRILLSGATYVLISAALCIFLFPKLITITAFSILIISDASSALFGRVYGTHPFLDKSREGSIAFVVSAWIVIAISPKALGIPAEYVLAAVAAVLGAIIEAASVRLRFDDNLSVPTTVGFSMWGFYYLLERIDPSHFHALWVALQSFN